MRSSTRRGATALSLVVAAFSGMASSRLATAEGDAPRAAAYYEPTPGLVAAVELGLGGRPLYQRLFPSGWPTTKDYRHLTLECGEASFNDGVASLLASGLGVPLSVSASERARLEERQKSDPRLKTVDDALRDRYEQFRQFSGLGTPVDKEFAPIFIPFRRGEPSFAKPFEADRPWTWTWDAKPDANVTLDAVGLAMYANALYAQSQLTVEHSANVGGNAQTCVGRTDVDGFMGLVALNCAVAAMNEARLKLCMDARGEKEELAAYPPKYDPQSEYGKSTYYPHAFVPTVNKATVTWAVGNAADAKKSRLFDQAALLLGTCEVIKASAGKGGTARFFSTEKKTGFFDPATNEQATAFATFLVECLSRLHAQSGNWASFADRASAGPALRAEDAGLTMLALASFLAIKTDKAEGFGAAQKKASIMLERISSFMMNVQKTSNPPNTGFCDVYSLAGDGSAAEFLKSGEEKRSLAAQGLMVRGLLATKGACDLPGYSGAKKQPQLRESALAAMRWLEDKRWSRERKVYLDPSEPGKVRALDSFAVLGALRDAAFETGDVRYLLRYKAQLTTLRQAGMVLSDSPRGRTAVEPGRGAGGATRPPVVAAEVNLP